MTEEDNMAKVSHLFFIVALAAVAYTFPLEEERTSNVPHVLPQSQAHEDSNKGDAPLHPSYSTPEVEQPKQEQPQHATGSQQQGSTPKPVHHYRDGPIIQRRSAESDESSSSEEDNESDERKKPEYQNNQRRDTNEEIRRHEDHSTFQKKHPSLLASNPNVQTPPSRPDATEQTRKVRNTDENQKVPHVLVSNPSSQTGASTSPQHPASTPASSTTQQVSGERRNDNQKQRIVRNLHDNQHPAYPTPSAATPKEDNSRLANQQHVLTLPQLQPSGSQNKKASQTGSGKDNQEQPQRQVRDVTKSQPHVLASNPVTDLKKSDGLSTTNTHSTVGSISSPTTEDIRESHSHIQRIQ